MSNERWCECRLQERAATVGTTNCPKTYEHADLRACRTQQNECPKPAHVLASGSGFCSKKKEELWGLTTGINVSDFPAKFCTNPGIFCSVDIDGVYTIQLWPPGQPRPADPLGL